MAFILPLALAGMAAAQIDSPPPSFEVASVRPSGAKDRVIGLFTHPGGRITASNYTLEMLMIDAFDVQAFQISGGPRWIREDRFTLDARPPAGSQSSHSNPSSIKLPPNEEQRRMLQALLAERFQLKYRRVSKEGPVYLLVKNGRELKLGPPKEKDGFPWVGNPGGGMILGGGVAGENASMPLLAKRLSRYVERPVIDRTGIDGSFDFRYDYAAGDSKPDVVATIFTSLQGLGLKLEPARGPVETIAIESVERPSAN